MPKAFDPNKATDDAKATIEAAQARLATLIQKVPAADEKVAKATKAQTDAAAAKQKQVDDAKAKKATLQAKIDAEKALIARQEAYLKATANLNAEPVVVPEPVPEPALVG